MVSLPSPPQIRSGAEPARDDVLVGPSEQPIVALGALDLVVPGAGERLDVPLGPLGVDHVVALAGGEAEPDRRAVGDDDLVVALAGVDDHVLTGRDAHRLRATA